jgi:hypothetical protein
MLLLSISRTAVSFVGAIYSLIGSLLMLCNFVYQIMLISQNVTSQEFHQATQRGLRTGTYCVRKQKFLYLEKNILCVKNNIEKQLSNTQIKE